MNRLFTFGCSFTHYCWQTWVDSIADQFDVVQNWGMAGGGNQSMSIRLTQCHKSHNITKNDTVLIMWTNIAREDKWSPDGWTNHGNLFKTRQNTPENLKDLQWYALKDFSMIANTVWLLNHLGCKYEMYSMIPITEMYDQYQEGINFDKANTIADVFRDELEIIKPSVLDVVYDGNWINKKDDIRDMHPLPGDHLKYMDLVSSFTPSESARKRAYEQDIWIKDKIASFGDVSGHLVKEEMGLLMRNKKNHRIAMSGLQSYELISY